MKRVIILLCIVFVVNACKKKNSEVFNIPNHFEVFRYTKHFRDFYKDRNIKMIISNHLKNQHFKDTIYLNQSGKVISKQGYLGKSKYYYDSLNRLIREHVRNNFGGGKTSCVISYQTKKNVIYQKYEFLHDFDNFTLEHKQEDFYHDSLSQTYVYNFNNDGLLIKSGYSDTDEERTEYHYNENNQLILEEYYHYNTLNTVTKLKYNENGFLQKVNHFQKNQKDPFLEEFYGKNGLLDSVKADGKIYLLYTYEFY